MLLFYLYSTTIDERVNQCYVWLFAGENAVFRTPVEGCGAAPGPAQRRGGGSGGGRPRLVHPGQLRDGVRLHDLVSGYVCPICGELCHVAPLHKLLVLSHQRRGI